MSIDLSVKSVTTAIAWEYKNLPLSKVRCALCLVDCTSTAEGPSEDVGIVKYHPQCGAVVHDQCLKKFIASPSPSSQDCPQCHKQATWSAALDLFAVRK
jgi:hypothetical protein